jgi:hypothetical protein
MTFTKEDAVNPANLRRTPRNFSDQTNIFATLPPSTTIVP